jgi:DNA polymerase I
MSQVKKAILVDANHLLSRTIHVPSFQALRSEVDGEFLPTGATFGFIVSLKRMIEKYKNLNDTIIIVWDGGHGFRKQLSVEYKATRASRTPDFIFQLDLTKQFLRTMGIAQCCQVDVEADDIIATLARRARLKDYDVLIISGDKDFNQIVSDHVNVLNPKGHNEYVLMTPESVKEHYGISSTQFVDYLALLGDSSDNVAGIEGVGKKTAAELIMANGTIEDMIAADVHYKLDEDGQKKPVSKKLQEKLNASKPIMKLAKELVLLRDDFDEFELDNPEPDLLALKAMFKKYSFKTLLSCFDEYVALFS